MQENLQEKRILYTLGMKIENQREINSPKTITIQLYLHYFFWIVRQSTSEIQFKSIQTMFSSYANLKNENINNFSLESYPFYAEKSRVKIERVEYNEKEI